MIKKWKGDECCDCHGVKLFPLFKKPKENILIAIRYCPRCRRRFQREEPNPFR